jgi:Cellulase N-terminal ig-like domain
MDIISERPDVRVNQLGYLLGRPKQATLVSDAEEPIHFTVRDRDGVAVDTGLSQPWPVRPEPTSGLTSMSWTSPASPRGEPASGLRLAISAVTHSR